MFVKKFQSEPFYAIKKVTTCCVRERHELLFVHRHRQSGFSARGFSFAYRRLRIQTASAFSFAWLLYADSGYVAPNNYWSHYGAVIRSDNPWEACNLDWFVRAFSCCFRNDNCYLRCLDCWWMGLRQSTKFCAPKRKFMRATFILWLVTLSLGVIFYFVLNWSFLFS